MTDHTGATSQTETIIVKSSNTGVTDALFSARKKLELLNTTEECRTDTARETVQL